MKKKLLILLVATILVACGKKDDTEKLETEKDNKIEVESQEKDTENQDTKEDTSRMRDIQHYQIAIKELQRIADEYPKSTVASDAISELEKIEEDESSIKFKDDSGRDFVRVKKHPKKVAVLYASYASMYDELGGKIDLIIGGDRAQELYEYQRGRDISQGKSIVTTSPSGKNWNVESIIAEQPDLIICAMTSNGYGTIREAAEVADIDLIGISFNGVRDYAKWSYIFTAITGNVEAFEEVALNTIEQVSRIISSVPEDVESPRVLSIMPTAKSVKGNYTQSDLGTILEDLGTINTLEGEVEKGKSPRVDLGLEDIIKMNPEYILIQCMDSEEYARTSVENHLSDKEAWFKLKAVEDEQINYLPRGLFHNKPNSKYTEAYKMVFDILYK